MGFTKENLLARLQIDNEMGASNRFSRYEHHVVLTVEDQAKYVGHLKGGLSKNLFQKDKKQRFYIISALAETEVDLKVLSQRLGLGKGGLRMAPEEALVEILQLLMLVISTNSSAQSEKKHAYMDLEANPKVWKDQPPDLAAFVSSDAKELAVPVEKTGLAEGSDNHHVTVNNNKPTVMKAVKPSNASTKEK